MTESNVLRMAFIMGNGQSQSFSSSLYKIVCAVIFDQDNKFLSCYEIKKLIENQYELVFTTKEIEDVFLGKRYTSDFVRQPDKAGLKYCLSPVKCEKMKTTAAQYSLQNIVESYKKESGGDCPTEKLISLLTLFLYSIFNKNQNAIMGLIKHSYQETVEKIDFSEDEKDTINAFLEWENSAKDEFVMNTVTYCVDYCMLTLKKDNKSFQSLFSGKTFYLDANIILRLIGINNQERKTVLQEFVDRCNECGIALYYTNFTYKEVTQSIDSFVNKIAFYFKGKRPVKDTFFKKNTVQADDQDIFDLYLSWCAKYGPHNDYQAFKKYLLNMVQGALKSARKETFMDYASIERERYLSLSESLKQYKTEKNAKVKDLAITYDTNNIMFLWSLRQKEKGSNLFDTNSFFISADSKLCEWCKIIVPGDTPICILPSVWYSLILKFKGRSKDDYRAFSAFLTLRYRENHSEEEGRRAKAVAIVQNLDEAYDIKNKILEQMFEELTWTNSAEPIEAVVEKTHNSIIQEEIEKIHKEQGLPLVQKGELQAYTKLAEASADIRINRFKKILNGIPYVKIALGCFVIGYVIYGLLSGKALALFIDWKQHEILDTVIAAIPLTGGFACIFILNPIKEIISHKVESREEIFKAELEKIIKKSHYAQKK